MKQLTLIFVIATLSALVPLQVRAQRRNQESSSKQGTHVCDVGYSRELKRLSTLYPKAGYETVKFWVFGPEGYQDHEGGPRLRSARITLSKSRGYLVVTSSPRAGKLTITGASLTGQAVHLDGSATIENMDVSLKPSLDCGAILLLGSKKPIVKAK